MGYSRVLEEDGKAPSPSPLVTEGDSCVLRAESRSVEPVNVNVARARGRLAGVVAGLGAAAAALLCLGLASPLGVRLRAAEAGSGARVSAANGQPLHALATDGISMVAAASGCAVLWGQCGGNDWRGATCCQGGNLCQHKPLEGHPSYMQCRPPPPPACVDAQPGSACFTKVTYDQTTGIHVHPDWYHGLNPESTFKEFQEFEAAFNKGRSQCEHPCAPGTCNYVFSHEGCDSVNEWMCKTPDDSLTYKCCCEYFHGKSNMTGPPNPSAELIKAMRDSQGTRPVLFCTALCLPKSYEVDLIRSMYSKGKLGLFGCNSWAVYSNTTIQLSPDGEYPLALTTLIQGSLDAKFVPGIKPGDPWTVSNTDVFLRFWRKVVLHQNAMVADWTVKVDPDTVFIPGRLRAMLLTDQEPLNKPDPENGLYLNNCHFGMHGPIEVISRNALLAYKRARESCENGEPGTHGQEDWFLRNCFQQVGVAKVEAYNLLFEGRWSCDELASSRDPYGPPCFAAQIAFHPFKDAQSWMHCYQEAANHPWALPTVLISQPPGPENERHT